MYSKCLIYTCFACIISYSQRKKVKSSPWPFIHHPSTRHACERHPTHRFAVSHCFFPRITPPEIPWIHQLGYQIRHDKYFTANGSVAWWAAIPPCPERATRAGEVRHREMCCTRHTPRDNHTAWNNAAQNVDERQINLHLVRSPASAVPMCVYVFELVLFLYKILYI